MLGPFHPCFESAEPEWPSCYRATSTHDLSWDGDRLARSPKSPPDPLHRPLRGRAFSESHLNLEPVSPRGCDRRDLLHAKLDPPGVPKKKGPPPPRPPPPNWEKYRQRRTSQHLRNGSGHGSAFTTAPVPTRSIAEAVRERSQSLTGEQGGRSRGHAAHPPAPLGAWPQPNPSGSLHRTSEPDPGSAEICRQVLLQHGGGWEQGCGPSLGTGWLSGLCGPLNPASKHLNPPVGTGCGVLSGWGMSLTSFPGVDVALYVPIPHGWARELTWVPLAGCVSRAEGAGEERLKVKHPWEMEEQPQRLSRNQERGWAGPRGVGECSLPLHGGPGPATPEEPKPSPGAVEGASCQGGQPQPCRVDSEELLWDVAGRDRSLASILAPSAPLGTTTELMGELLVVGERQAWRERFQQDWHLEALAQDR